MYNHFAWDVICSYKSLAFCFIYYQIYEESLNNILIRLLYVISMCRWWEWRIMAFAWHFGKCGKVRWWFHGGSCKGSVGGMFLFSSTWLVVVWDALKVAAVGWLVHNTAACIVHIVIFFVLIFILMVSWFLLDERLSW